MSFIDCDWCGDLFNWVFPDPQLLVDGQRLFFCKEKCKEDLNKKRAQQKLKSKGIIK